MNLRAMPLLDRQWGYTLVELMIALTLGLLVIGGASALFLSNKQSYRTGEAISRVQEDSRMSFELMSRDIRSVALTGCGNSGRVANVIKNASTYWWANWGNPIIGYGGASADTNPALTTGTAVSNHVSGTDSVILIGADDVAYSISAGADGSSTAPFKTNETSNLQTGDVIIACTAGGGAALQQATIAQITSAPTSGYVTGASGATPGNCSTGLGYPTNCTTANAFTFPYSSTLVARLKAVSWYIGVNQQGTNSLYRMALTNGANISGGSAGTASTQAQEMVRNVGAFQLKYLVSGNTDFEDATTVGTANWGAVNAVQISITLQSVDTHASVNATALTNQTVTAVALRNRVN